MTPATASFVRAAIATTDGLGIDARGRLRVDGKTETAVGEVGATLRLESGYGGGDASPWEAHEGENV